MQFPKINVNGTAASDLVDVNVKARNALVAAVNTLAAAAPHPRDYQTIPETEYRAAVSEHVDRTLNLRRVLIELDAIVENLLDQ